MQTWPERHSEWSYRVYDNDYLLSRRFRNQHLINEYVRRGKWAGVSDLMRYEILLDEGGFIPEADSLCLHPVDSLFEDDLLYSVYEYPNGRTGMMSPFLASVPDHPILQDIVSVLHNLSPTDLNQPWHSTGNGFLKRYFARTGLPADQIRVFPSHYFIPEHHKEPGRYDGQDVIYAEQMWATTSKSYAFRKAPTAQYKQESAARSAELYRMLTQVDL